MGLRASGPPNVPSWNMRVSLGTSSMSGTKTAPMTTGSRSAMILTPMTPTDHPVPATHPVSQAMMAHRAADLQLKIADRITAFAGSMPFVYLHAAVFAVWMIVFEKSPWPTLTLIVSLEAIFLSTFVMIGQNRQAAFQQAKADHDFVESELELKSNTELTRQIHALTTELHRRVVTDARAEPPAVGAYRRTPRDKPQRPSFHADQP